LEYYLPKIGDSDSENDKDKNENINIKDIIRLLRTIIKRLFA
jgi:hypothetical protein